MLGGGRNQSPRRFGWNFFVEAAHVPAIVGGKLHPVHDPKDENHAQSGTFPFLEVLGNIRLFVFRQLESFAAVNYFKQKLISLVADGQVEKLTIIFRIGMLDQVDADFIYGQNHLVQNNIRQLVRTQSAFDEFSYIL